MFGCIRRLAEDRSRTYRALAHCPAEGLYTAPMAGTPPTQGGRRRSVGIMPVERRACDIPRSTNMLRSNLTIEQRVELLGWEGDTVHPTPFTKSDEARAKAMLKEEREKLRKDRMQK